MPRSQPTLLERGNEVHGGDSQWITTGPPVLTLEAADAMASAALAEATARSFNDISVCVVDASGRVLNPMVYSAGRASAAGGAPGVAPTSTTSGAQAEPEEGGDGSGGAPTT